MPEPFGGWRTGPTTNAKHDSAQQLLIIGQIICLPRIREYHDNAAHTTDTWLSMEVLAKDPWSLSSKRFGATG
ncbi:hypothetical protein IVA89_24880 [Bradyrhizobium sp. 150]|nr:hypothetical protein [Bradyrhizobium sp. 150]